jgi:hypothetical protein
MFATATRTRTQAGPTLLAAGLTMLIAGGATTGNINAAVRDATTTSPAAGALPTPPRTGELRIAIRVGEEISTGTLAETTAARTFAAMLPVTIAARDLFGQAMAGKVPRTLAIGDAAGASQYSIGDVGYWSPSGDLAIFYADDGQSLPPPGLVSLGTVDGGLSAIADAGNRATMTIELAD